MNHAVKVLYGTLLCSTLAFGQPFQLQVTGGEVTVKSADGAQVSITDSGTVTLGDSLMVPAGGEAAISIEENSRCLFRGAGAISLSGDSSSLNIAFDQGQAFLDRNPPEKFSMVTFWVKNYMFMPTGTAASIKIMENGMPSVAVTGGKMLMQAPTGESIEVEAGKTGSITGQGTLALGDLDAATALSLEKWSGVKAKFAVAQTDSEQPSEKEASVSPAVSSPAIAKNANDDGEPAAGPVPVQTDGAVGASPEETGVEEPAKSPEKGEAPTKAAEGVGKPTFEISASTVTVDDAQWTRMAVGVDVPIWKFGVFLDLEAFLDPQGQFSDKGWDFGDDWFNALQRKIRYIRYGHEDEKLFVKLGGLSNVTLGYGFVVDRFTNMLHYPDQKLAGLQVYVNDVTPIGLTVQFMGADARELSSEYEGGVGAARVAVRPLKLFDLPIISRLQVGALYARDNNIYAPSRNWKPTANQTLVKALDDRNVLDDPAIVDAFGEAGIDVAAIRQRNADEAAKKNGVEHFGIIGGDIGLPLIATSLLSLDLYGQGAIRDDDVRGWGFGAPGLALKVWRLIAGIEYRHVEGRFVPGFFGPYYLDERLVRNPKIETKVDMLPDDTLDGVYGRLGFDIADVLLVNGGYQYMVGRRDESSDQRFEITGNIGSVILSKIPRIKKLEAYLYKTRIGTDIVSYDSLGAVVLDANGDPTYDSFFEKTPYFYYGYRLGIELAPGATLIADTRYGWVRNATGKLESKNSVTVQTAVTF